MQLDDPPDRPAGPEGAAPADRRRRRHQEGVLRRASHRPRHAEGRADGARAKAAWTSRRSRTTRPRRSSRSSSIRSTGLTRRAGRRAGARHRHSRSGSQAQARRRVQEALPLLHGDRRVAGRDQPADPRGQRQHQGARREVQLRLQRAVPPSRDRRATATSTKKIRPKSRRASSTSPTSSSTATSAAWSTAPAWRWRRWTPSSCSAASRPTSSTWAAAPRPRRSPRRSRSCCATRNVKAILVNIFGGIMRCDTIAEGVIAACKAVEPEGAAGGAHEGHQRGARQEDAGRVGPADHQRRHHGRRRDKESWPPCVEPSAQDNTMSILIDKNTRSSPRASPARPASSTPADVPRLRQRQELLRRRRQSEEGRRRLRGHPDLRQRQGSEGQDTGATVSA